MSQQKAPGTIFTDAKQRFSNRVADYLRYRPHYPEAVIDFLREHAGLSPDHVIADIGSGTGFLSELFLKNGNTVIGVEPNSEMREAGEEYLAGYPRFSSTNGSAEDTTLAESSVDFVVAGQAFHWFDAHATRREFSRILRKTGWVAIVWNDRTIASTEFALDYENLLLRCGTDYARVKDAYPRLRDIKDFFAHRDFLKRELPNHQNFDLDGLRGRARSSSYVPAPEDPKFGVMMDDLEAIFLAHQQNGQVRMDFSTVVYLGQLPDSSRAGGVS